MNCEVFPRTLAAFVDHFNLSVYERLVCMVNDFHMKLLTDISEFGGTVETPSIFQPLEGWQTGVVNLSLFN